MARRSAQADADAPAVALIALGLVLHRADRAMRIARRALNAAASIGRADAAAAHGSAALGYWTDRYLASVQLDGTIGEREPSEQTHRARENALAIARAFGVIRPGISSPIAVGAVDPDIAVLVGDIA